MCVARVWLPAPSTPTPRRRTRLFYRKLFRDFFTFGRTRGVVSHAGRLSSGGDEVKRAVRELTPLLVSVAQTGAAGTVLLRETHASRQRGKLYDGAAVPAPRQHGLGGLACSSGVRLHRTEAVVAL